MAMKVTLITKSCGKRRFDDGLSTGKQLPGPFDPDVRQKLKRWKAGSLLKTAKKMVRAETREFRQFRQRDFTVVGFADVFDRGTKRISRYFAAPFAGPFYGAAFDKP